MADELRKIVIEIKTTDEETQEQKLAVKPTDSSGKVKRTEKKSLESILLNQAYNQAKSLVSQSINSSLNRYYNMKEDYMRENAVNTFKTIVGKTSSFATTVAGGFALGNVAGAVISGTGWVVNEAINIDNTWKDTYAEINATNYNKTFTKQRLGLVDSGRGTEN